MAVRMPPEGQRRPVHFRLLPGPAGQFIGLASEHVRAGDKLVICCRVSERVQGYTGNLNDQERHLRNRAHELGAIVVGVVRRVWPGTYPIWLVPAVELAKTHDAQFLFAESTDRFVRNPGFHPKNWPEAQARITELNDLRDWTSGFPLVTDNHPDAEPALVKSFQIRRGQTAKNRKGGRTKKLKPRGKERREKFLSLAIQMSESGMSTRQIAKRLEGMMDGEFPPVSKSTISNWLNNV